LFLSIVFHTSDIGEYGAYIQRGKNTSILFRGPNWAKICNLFHLQIFILSKSKMKFW